MTLDLLIHDQEFRKAVQDRWQYILVDEFQDTNAIQYALLKQILGEAELFAVGDDDQSIYGFRGAIPELFLQFEDLFSNSQLLLLEENYRSMGNIIEAAGDVIKNNHKRRAKEIWTGKDAGKQLVLAKHQYQQCEEHWIIDILNQSADRTAILYRTNLQGKKLSDLLTANGIEHLLVSNASLLNDHYGRVFYYALLSSLTANSRMKALYQQTLNRMLGMSVTWPSNLTSIQLLEELKNYWQPDACDMTYILLSDLTQKFPDLKELSEAITLSENQTLAEFSNSKIILMTIHSAKGLEFARVVLPELEMGVFPSNGQNIEEERRLFYVALTRAANELYLSYCNSRQGFDKKPSLFLNELPKHLIQSE
jgi:DNA helicase-2/ATP-dependent DNA helicase PcrA